MGGRAEQQAARRSAARGAPPTASAAVSTTCSITSPAHTTSKLASASAHGPSAATRRRSSSGCARARGAAAPRRRRRRRPARPARASSAAKRPSPQPTSSTRSPALRRAPAGSAAQREVARARALGQRLPERFVVVAQRHRGTRLERGSDAARAVAGAPTEPRCSEAVIPVQCAKRLCCLRAARRHVQQASETAVRVAFDSRPVADPRGVGRYSRCLLRGAARHRRRRAIEIVETPPRRAQRRRLPLALDGRRDAAQPLPDGRHVHDLAALKRRSEHLRSGPAPAPAPPRGAARRARDRADRGRRARRRRSTCASSASAIAVIPEAADASMYPRPAEEVAAARAALRAARALPGVGRRPAAPRPAQARRRARRHAARAAARARRPARGRGRTSCPT